MLASADGFLFDLDGTLFQGEQLIEGADQMIAQLKAFQKRILLVSDQGSLSSKSYLAKLHRMGIPVEEHEVLLSSTVVARFLRRHYPEAEVWILSGNGLKEELAAHGVQVCETSERANWIAISLHETMSYAELKLAFKTVKSGARIIVINGELRNDSAAVDNMIRAIEDASGRHVDVVVIGKSSYLMGDAALDLLGLQPEKCVVVGDDLTPSIQLGMSYGMQSVMVLTDAARKEQLLHHHFKPHYIVESIHEILEQLASS